MLNVTSAALDCLSMKLANKRRAADLALRLTHKRSGWKLRLDRARPSDAAITHEGKKLLLLDEAAVLATAELTLDVSPNQPRTRLKLRHVTKKDD